VLTRRLAFALIVVATSLAASARAEPPAQGEGEAHAPVKAAANPSIVYANIYQGPLFGALYAIASNEAAVDESALKYYASLHNTARVDAEIRRLKALHPNWSPPANLYSTAGSGNDEQPFWDLLAENRFEELHAGLALKMKSEPGWKPSRDLSAKVARKEAINALVAAFDAGAWNRVLEIADSDPTVLHCSHMDANWRVADAFINLNMPARGFEIYHAILASCSDHEERLVTVRKAISRFSVDQVKSLIAMGSRSDDGTSEFDAAKIDLTRARIAAVNSGKGQDDIGETDLAAFFAETEKTRVRSDLILAGWYQYDHERYGEAGHWFSLGAPRGPPGKDEDDVKFAEGAALSRLKAGDPEGAAAMASPWRDVAPPLRQTYATAMITLLTRTDPPAHIEDAVLQDFVKLAQADRSFDAANALAWRAMRAQSYEEAAGWFKIGLAWKAVDPLGPAPEGATELNVVKAIEGYARALQALHRDEEALAIADNWRETESSIRALFIDLANSVVNAAERVEAIAPDRFRHITEAIAADHVATGAEALGWLYYRSADYPQATTNFAEAVAWSANGKGNLKTNQGLALALQKEGRLAEAEEVAWAWREDQDARATYVSVVSAELSADQPGVGLSPPRLERFLKLVRADRNAVGAQAVGWYRLRQGNCSFAAPWFHAASSWSADRSDVKIAEGLTLAQQAVGDLESAENTAYAWRDRSSRMRGLYFAIGAEALAREIPKTPVSETRISRYSRATLLERDVIGARALGWRRYREAGCGYGGNWFRLSTVWNSGQPGDMKTDEGHALALSSIGRLAEASSLVKRWSSQDPLMRKAYIDYMIEELSRDNPPEPMDEARLSEFEAVVEPDKAASAAQALGWYRLERGELADAEKWFKKAVDWWPKLPDNPTGPIAAPADDYKPLLARLALTIGEYRRTPRAYPNSSNLNGEMEENYVETAEGAAKTWEGYAQTLRALGRVEEAERIAMAWRDRWPSLRRLYLDMARDQLSRDDSASLSKERLANYYDAIDADRDVDGAAAAAWRLHRGKDEFASADWFSKAVSWSEARPGSTPDLKLIEGYAIALRGAKKYDEALALAEKWRSASPRFNLLYLETTLLALRESGRVDTLSTEKYAEAEKAMAEARSSDGALSVGWVAYENSDFAGALKWFHNAVDWSQEAKPDPKALEGLALSLRALGRYDELADLSRRWRDEVFEVRRAYYDGLMEALSRAEAAEPFNTDTRMDFEALAVADRNPPAAQAMGWDRAAHKDWIGSRSWFRKAVEWRGFDPLSPGDGARADPGNAKLVEGYVQSLRGVGSLGEAEDLAYLWRDRGVGLSGLYLQIFTQELANPDVHLSADRVARFANVTLTAHSVVGASNLGWLTYRQSDYNAAIDWFEKAIAWSPEGKGDKKTNEGYALALRGAGRLTEGEAFAWAHRDESKEIRAAYVAVVIDELAKPELAAAITPARLARFEDIVMADQFAAGAQAIGWMRLQQDNCVYAAPWFRRAVAWSSSVEEKDRARSGLSQALRKAGAFAESEEVAYAGIRRNAELRKLYINVVIEELTREWLRPPVDEPRIARFAGIALADRSSIAAQALGWSRYDLAGSGFGGQWLRLAAAWSQDGVGDAKLNEGYALTMRAVGKLADAEAIVWPWVASVPAMKKLYIDIVVEELSRDTPPEPLPQPRLSRFESVITPISSAVGAQALGWYRYSRGENEEAVKWFAKALDWWPHPKDDTNQKLSLPVEDYHPILARLALRIEDYRRTPRAYPNSSLLVGKATESYTDAPESLAKTVEGYVLALGGLSRWDEAARLAWDWRDRWPRLRELFIEIAISQLNAAKDGAVSKDTLEKLATLVDADHSARGAEALAWQALGAHDYDSASRWFHSTLEWVKPDTPANLDLVRAYATALKESKRYDEALKLIDAWRGRLPDLAPMVVDVQLAEFAGLDAASPEAERKLPEIAKNVSAAKSSVGAAALGWLAYQRKETQAALAWFKQAIVWTPAGGAPAVNSLEGYARSLQAEQRYSDMLTFTSQWSARVPELKPLYADAAISALAAAAASGEDVPMETLTRAGSAFAEAKSVDGAQALAWQRITAKDWVAAAAWFQAARNWRQGQPEDPKLVEGQIIALRNLNRIDDAEELAFKGAARDGSLRDLYIEIVSDRLTRNPPIPPNEAGMRRFAEMALAAKSANGAQALGWYSYNVRQLPAAIAWFDKSLSWDPNENAALGLAFAYRLNGDRAAYQQIVAEYRDKFAKIADLAAGRPPGGAAEKRAAVETGSAPAPAAELTELAPVEEEPARPRARASSRGEGGSISAALSAKDYRGCVERAESRADSLAAGDRNALGWCLLNLGRTQEAAQAFDSAMRGSTGKLRDEAAYGKSLALLQAGEASPAVHAASQANLGPEQRNSLGVGILERRAWDAYNGKRYAEALQWADRRAAFAPETRDMLNLRVLSLDGLGEHDAAQKLRGALDAQLAP
jgi:hypothetical protein